MQNFHATGAYNLYPHGRHLHATWIKSTEICMWLAATRIQFVCDWRPLRYNLHVTGGHPVTRQETSSKRCVKGRLYIIIISFYHWQVHILYACFRPLSRRPLDIWFGKCAQLLSWRPLDIHMVSKMCWYNKWHSHREANFACASGQLRTKPPVLCKHAARTIIWI
jgi:hypothetical protein